MSTNMKLKDWQENCKTWKENITSRKEENKCREKLNKDKNQDKLTNQMYPCRDLQVVDIILLHDLCLQLFLINYLKI
jgi:hypothetical protein